MITPNAPHWLPAILLFSTTLTSGLAQSPLLTCYQDNQLRALERFSTQASNFCPTYLTPPATTTAPNAALPTYVADFQSPDISSACECFQASATESAVVLTLSATPPSTAKSSPSAPSQPTSAPSASQGEELTTGAKAGIGIGCAVVGLAVLLGAALMVRRKRKPRRRNGVEGAKRAERSRLDDGEAAELPPSYEAVEKDAGECNHELGGGDRFELLGHRTSGGG